MLEEIFQQKICTCFHSIKDEHEFGKCYALDFNGSVWIACRCTNIKIKPLTFRVERNEIPTNTITNNRTNIKSTPKPIQSPANVFQWGKKAGAGK